MAFIGVDHRGLPFTAAGDVGDDFKVTVGLLDMAAGTGAVNGTTAAVVCTVGDVSMTVDKSTTAGHFVCSLTEVQTATLGDGAHAWLLRVTPSGGDTQTYVRGTVSLSSSASAGGSFGWQGGVVGSVFVVVT